MNRRLTPPAWPSPPLPPEPDEEDFEATSMAEAIGAPPPLPGEPPDNPRTNTGFAVPSMPDGGETELSRAGKAARQKADERLREPAPRGRRPTLLPGDMPPKLPGAPRTVQPGLVAPVQARADSSRPDLVGRQRESSDVIQTFHSSGSNHDEPVAITDHTPRPAPRPRAQLQRMMPRPSARNVPQRTAPPPVRNAPAARPAPAGPAILPLNAEMLSVHIADQRRRLHVIDGFARVLEIAAGIVGTLALACLIAALVSILVGSDVSVLAASAAIVGCLSTLALTLMMVVGAIALRQLAHASAQTAALLEALTGYRR